MLSIFAYTFSLTAVHKHTLTSRPLPTPRNPPTLQSKLREYESDGTSTNNQINMAGGTSSWSAIENSTDANGDVTTYWTTFTKTSGSVTFTLTAFVVRTVCTYSTHRR